MDQQDGNRIHVIRVPEREERKGSAGKAPKKMTENFPTLAKDRNLQVQIAEPQTGSNKRNLYQDTTQ